jgi:secondary thiamine-phosphate synthase enzyme
MVVLNRVLAFSTTNRRQLIDISDATLKFVRDCDVRDGLLTISVPHATAAVIANENERGLLHDILSKLEMLFPQSPDYAHNRIDDNADAHLAATFLGHSRSFPIMNHQLVRGTWQNIFLVELDGPRSRREVHLSIIG